LPNVVEAVRSGIPTAIFEDPMPAVYEGIPGTGEPKQPAGNPMMGGMGGAPQPKGDIQELWKVLGLDIPVQFGMQGINPDIVWQKYNPHPKLQYLMNANDAWLFILEGQEEGEDYLSEESKITAGLRELMFLFAGAVDKDEDRDDLNVVDLVKTREAAGLISFDDLSGQMRSTDASAAQLEVLQGEPTGEKVVAVYVESVSGQSSQDSTDASDEATSGESDAAGGEEDDESDNSSSDAEQRPIKAVYVADVDYMHPFFSENRKRPEQFEEIDLRVQNITFVLNIVDVLAGELDYPTIRSHEPQHITLSLFEDQAEEFRQEAFDQQREFQKDFNQQKTEAEQEMEQKIASYRDELAKLDADGATDEEKRQKRIRIQQKLQIESQVQQRKVAVQTQQLALKRDTQIKESKRESESAIRKLQNRYKMLAIFLPPIPPLLVGAGVFVSRRVREREGISKNRLK
jgi:ABC-2 type transport system permease protein